jgi:hypothetical protein
MQEVNLGIVEAMIGVRLRNARSGLSEWCRWFQNMRELSAVPLLSRSAP